MEARVQSHLQRDLAVLTSLRDPIAEPKFNSHNAIVVVESAADMRGAMVGRSVAFLTVLILSACQPPNSEKDQTSKAELFAQKVKCAELGEARRQHDERRHGSALHVGYDVTYNETHNSCLYGWGVTTVTPEGNHFQRREIVDLLTQRVVAEVEFAEMHVPLADVKRFERTRRELFGTKNTTTAP